jgi:hypothetical protein
MMRFHRIILVFWSFGRGYEPRLDSPVAGTFAMRRVWTGSRKIHRTFEGQAVLLSGTAPEWSQTRLDGYR